MVAHVDINYFMNREDVWLILGLTCAKNGDQVYLNSFDIFKPLTKIKKDSRTKGLHHVSNLIFLSVNRFFF